MRTSRRTGAPRLIVFLVLTSACSKQSAVLDASSPSDGVDGAPIDVPGVPGQPGLGAHVLIYYRQGESSSSAITTPPMSTQTSGSTILVSVGRGIKALFALPTDNKGNSPYQQLGTVHAYEPAYPNSGTALYGFPAAAGGAGFRISNSTDDNDEITVAAVEVVGGTRIQAFEWNMAPTGDTVTSRKVTTTGPATLVAFWWGDASQYFDKTAVPNNGFTVIDSVLMEGSLVQCAVAVKNVSGAGMYDVTWSVTPVQGAQLWLVAVQ